MIRLLKKIRDFYLARIKYSNYTIGKNFHAGKGVFFWGKNDIVIGDNFYIGRGSTITCDAIIGDNVLIANNVGIVGKYDHNYTQKGVPIRLASQIRESDYSWKGLKSKVIIGDDVWIGYGAVILSDVTIGKGAIVSAGAIVVKDVEPYSIIAGNPAKHIKYRFSEEEIVEHELLMKK